MKAPYTTKDLSPETWKDFERLFLKKGTWGSCWCMIFPRVSSPEKRYTGTIGRLNAQRDRREKEELVRAGLSHGILVYSGEDPVGWCQYGPREELPRIDAGNLYRRVPPTPGGGMLRRITCFWVARAHRNRGASALALRAALAAIKLGGGGLVEGYPAVGHGFPADWTGVLSTFRKEGFREVAPFGKHNVLVRRRI